jgi:hypothetical protein
LDRRILYGGAIPLETDILTIENNIMIAVGRLAAATLGTSTVADGLICAATSPASMTVNVGPGLLTSLGPVDTGTFGALAANSTQIVKLGIVNTSQAFSALTPPGTAGQSINYLIQAQYEESDTDSGVLSYFNPSNPALPYSGPSNNGLPNNSTRQQTIVLTSKTGAGATSGTQTTPTPDAGCVALWVVTVPFGATTLTGSNISTYPGAPFITSRALQTAGNVQAQTWTYWPDTGSSSAYAITPNPAITAYAAGQRFSIKLSNTSAAAPTLNVNGLGTRSLNYNDGTGIKAGDLITGGIIDVVFDGTNFEVISFSRQSAMRPYFALAGGTANAVTATVDTLPNLYTGLEVTLLLTATNTGSASLNVNGSGAITILRNDYSGGNPTVAGDLPSGGAARLVYNGTNWLLMNVPSIGTRGFRNMLSYAAGGTFTAPAGVTQVYVRMVGGGGGGGGSTSTSSAGGGGGGGGFAEGFVTVVPGTGYTIVCGAFGTASTGTGGNGGTSSFGSVLSATGGQGGGGASGSSAGNAGSGGGGAGSALLCSQTGGQGNSGCSTGAVWSGRGGSAGWGGGEGSGGNGTGGNAQAYGGGGGGTVNGTSGTGAQGAVNVYW